ncbi:GntR family transcriptional regulator [Pseudomonas putida]|nr:GntR family transcriptional regulator [Pseudomonas putida]
MSTLAMPLNRSAMTFLYEQLAHRLLDEIHQGLYADGRLPSEQALGERFSVSRVTVRQALDQLTSQGHIQKRHGKGTFVSDRPLLVKTHSLQGFYESLLEQGIHPETRLLEFQPLTGDDPRVSMLGDVGALPFWMRRLYLIEGQPFALVSACLPAAASKVSWQEASENPLYGILEHLLGFKVGQSDVKIGQQIPDVSVAQLLGTKTKQPLLTMNRASFDTSGLLLERSIVHMRPEYQFTFQSQGAFNIKTTSC